MLYYIFNIFISLFIDYIYLKIKINKKIINTDVDIGANPLSTVVNFCKFTTNK